MNADGKYSVDDLFLAVSKKYKDTVRKVCFRYLHDDADLCREMIQEVNIALWNKLDLFPHTASEFVQRRWVTTLAKQVVTNSLRRRKKLVAVRQEFLEAPSATIDGTGDIYDVMRTSLTLEEQWIAHHLVIGYSINELASAYDISPSAMRKRIDKLRAKLADALDRNE